MLVLDLESCLDPTFGALQNQRLMELGGNAIATPDNLAPLQDASHLFVTGSGMMVADTPWASSVGSAIQAAAESGTRVLGICYGHQLLAAQFGGKLGSFDHVRRGVPTLSFEAMGPFKEESLPVLHSHRDHVLDGGQMVSCGEGGFGGLAALRHPDLPIWTTQGHPEWTAELGRTISPDWEQPPCDTPGTDDIVRRFQSV